MAADADLEAEAEAEAAQLEQGPVNGPEAPSPELAVAEPLTAPNRDMAKLVPAAEPAAAASAASSADLAPPDDLSVQADGAGDPDGGRVKTKRRH